jgi:hypothetical protein
MKVKIEQVFKNKYTGRIYEVGEVIDVAEARGEELLADARHLVSPIEEEKPAAKKKSSKK